MLDTIVQVLEPTRLFMPAPETAGESIALDTAFIDGVALTVARSRQRYDRQGPGRLRYVDLGLSRGFEADVVVDGAGLVLRYENLFERSHRAEDVFYARQRRCNDQSLETERATRRKPCLRGGPEPPTHVSAHRHGASQAA